MSITDELRTGGIYRPASNRRYFTEKELTAIADRIDAEHEKGEREQYTYGYNEGYDEGYASADDCITDKRETLEEHGWVKLPVDADGVPIHVGDVLTDGEYTFRVDELTASGDGSWSIRNEHGNAWAACDVTHHHDPTVEDVVADVADKAANLTGSYHEGGMNGDEYMDSMRALVAEYAAKLRLVDDGKEQ